MISQWDKFIEVSATEPGKSGALEVQEVASDSKERPLQATYAPLGFLACNGFFLLDIACSHVPLSDLPYTV